MATSEINDKMVTTGDPPIPTLNVAESKSPIASEKDVPSDTGELQVKVERPPVILNQGVTVFWRTLRERLRSVFSRRLVLSLLVKKFPAFQWVPLS